MPDNVVGAIPEFTTDDAGSGQQEEVKKPDTSEETPGAEGKESPSELPAEDKPADEVSDDTEVKEMSLDETVDKAVERATVGLRGEIVTLREKLADAKTEGQRRNIEKKIDVVKDDIDELKDLHPDDVNVVDRILRSKGYITKKESQSMFYDSVKRETLDSFLEKYPEYKPENDPSDSKWASLQAEVGLYKMPADPHSIAKLLEKAHRAVSKTSSDPSIPLKKQQVQTAGVGSRGVSRSSSTGRLSDTQKEVYRQGGWSEEDIKSIEKNLPKN